MIRGASPVKLIDIYYLAVSMGMDADPRGRAEAEKLLKRTREDYLKLDEEEKRIFDAQSLFNPYSDSRLLLGGEDTKIKKVMAGIDIETPEVLLADRLNEKGYGIDLLLSHHPQGFAQAGLYDVVRLHEGRLAAYSIAGARQMVEEKIEEVRRKGYAGNHNRALNAARIMGFPFLCLHTVLDNLANCFIEELVEKEKPCDLGGLLDLLYTVPEYAAAAKNNAPPFIESGSPGDCPGNVYVDFTGGAAGPKGQYEKLKANGIDTVLTMYANDDTVKLVRELGINLIAAGHISSDSIGVNLFLDRLEEKGIEIVPVSGLIRVKRN